MPTVSGSSLLARIAGHADERPGCSAYRIPGGASLSYRDLANAVATLGESLRRQLPAGSVVILSCRNQLQYPVAFLAILAAGCTVFPIFSDAADAELLQAAAVSRASGLIGDERAIRLLRRDVQLSIPIEELALTGNPSHPDRNFGDLLLQSSGTTGLPKIVHRTGPSLNAAARMIADAVGLTPADRIMMTVPLTHSYGLEHGLLAPLWAGSCVHLSRDLALPTAVVELAREGVTVLAGVPSTFEMLSRVADRAAEMPTLRIAYAAGAPLPRSVFDAFGQRFGVRVTQLYGASEIGSVAYNAPEEPFEFASVGRAIGDTSIRILDVDHPERPLPRGQAGQVAVWAPSMFDDYLEGPADIIDGHFLTGDLGHLDETDRLFITGRIKLLIDIGGFKVNPLEVEAVLEQHPAVAACVVVAVRQSQTVFRLKAVLTQRDPAIPIVVDELRKLARSRLASYKVPRIFEVRESLPRSTGGKVLRKLLETT